MTYQELQKSGREYRRAVWEAARQKYQQEYEGGQQTLSWGLRNLLDSLAGLSYGEIVNELTKLQGDLTVVQQRAPGVCAAIAGLLSRQLGLRRQDIEAWLNLPPPAHDALDTLLRAAVRQHAHEARNGLLPLHCVVAAVNGDCGPNDGLTARLIASRLRAMNYVLTAHHPTSIVVIPRLLPPMLDVTLTRLLPSPEELSAREYTENGSRTQ